MPRAELGLQIRRRTLSFPRTYFELKLKFVEETRFKNAFAWNLHFVIGSGPGRRTPENFVDVSMFSLRQFQPFYVAALFFNVQWKYESLYNAFFIRRFRSVVDCLNFFAVYKRRKEKCKLYSNVSFISNFQFVYFSD